MCHRLVHCWKTFTLFAHFSGYEWSYYKYTREAWHAAAHGVTKSQTRLGKWTTTTIKISVQVIQSKYPRVGILNLIVITCLTLWETVRLFFRMAISFCIPTKSVQECQLLCILNYICMSILLNLRYSNRYVLLSHCIF